MRRQSTSTGLRPETVRTITLPLLTVRSSPSSKHEAEIAGDIGVFEIGFVVGSGRQDRGAPLRIY